MRWVILPILVVVAVVGAATGCQLASVLAAFGARVRLLEAAPRILGAEDESLSAGVAVLEPGLLKTRPMRVDVECESELTRGETVCDFYGVTGEPPNAEVGVDLDREGFFDLLHRSL
jgi:choline dehydrogenase-like flavoprotein